MQPADADGPARGRLLPRRAARTSAGSRSRSRTRRTRSPRRSTLPSGPTRTLHGTQPLVKRAEQRPVAVGDHRELEPVLLLPGATGLLGLDRADVDDLEPVAREPLMESDDGRTLLPTALSGRLPEDQQHPVRALDRQAQLGHRDGAPGSMPPESPSTTFMRCRLAPERIKSSATGGGEVLVVLRPRPAAAPAPADRVERPHERVALGRHPGPERRPPQIRFGSPDATSCPRA